MSNINKSYAYYELDGKVYGPHRIGLKTKLQYEKTAKVRKWNSDDDAVTTLAFWTWHASQQEHGLTFDDFLARVEDVNVETPEPAGEDGELGLDPTQTGTGDAS